MRTWTIAAGCALGFAPGALAQSDPAEDSPALLAEAVEMEFLGGPANLPGLEAGDRERLAPEQPAQPAEPAEREWFGASPWWRWSRATGDWAELRTRLEDRGLSFGASYMLDYTGAWSGGLSGKPTLARLFDLNATLDFDKAFGIKGGSLFADFQVISGNSPSRRIGDFQGTSNIESEESRNQVAELWYEQWLFDNVLRLKAGKIDANREFDFVDAAGEFLNSSAGLTATSAFLPCYPDPATGIVAFVYPTTNWYIGYGFFDGAASDGVRTGERGPATFVQDDLADGFFHTGETGVTFDLGFVRDLRIAVGVWHQEGDFTEFDGGEHSGSTGIYALAEGAVWKADAADPEDDRGLRVFFRYGHADEEVLEASNSVGGGLKLTGTFAGREADSAGLFVNWVDLSDEDGAGFASDETVIELYYRVSVTPFIHLVPDLQFVFNPSGSDEAGDAVVGSLRVSIDF